MKEGWYQDEYYILFEDAEVAEATQHYLGSEFLAGFSIIGLLSWDDFIVKDSAGTFYAVPTVPLDERYLKQFDFSVDPSQLISDQQFIGKLKWYITPLVFGGDPQDESNMLWATPEEHTELVNWWNKKYQEVRAQQQKS